MFFTNHLFLYFVLCALFSAFEAYDYEDAVSSVSGREPDRIWRGYKIFGLPEPLPIHIYNSLTTKRHVDDAEAAANPLAYRVGCVSVYGNKFLDLMADGDVPHSILKKYISLLVECRRPPSSHHCDSNKTATNEPLCHPTPTERHFLFVSLLGLNATHYDDTNAMHRDRVAVASSHVQIDPRDYETIKISTKNGFFNYNTTDLAFMFKVREPEARLHHPTSFMSRMLESIKIHKFARQLLNLYT